MERIVTNLMSAALMECCRPEVVDYVIHQPFFSQAVQLALGDLTAFANKDPAAHGRCEIIAMGYTSYKAVLHYRLAHALLNHCSAPAGDRQSLQAAVTLIASRGKLLSGAEIHAGSHIGKRFVLDHGYGTVIGETTVIGNDCYILGGVVLGAQGISGNPQGKRHPTLGDRVEIGAFARVFGNITIGNDVFIAPHCVIKQDIADQTIITLKSELQIARKRSRWTSLTADR